MKKFQALIWVKGDKAYQASMAAKGFTLGSGVTRYLMQCKDKPVRWLGW